MKRVFSLAVIVTAFVSGCAEKEPEKDTSIITSDTTKSNLGVSTDTTAGTATFPADTMRPGVSVMGAESLQPTTPTTAATGMNPAHGQPNHRCDIAVGAPLNSPVTKPAAPATQTINPTPTTLQSTPAITQTPAPKVKTAPGMNPPHGEPNHRCDIAVGAPLNSPVTKPAAQNITPQTVTPGVVPASTTTPPPVELKPEKKAE